MKKIIVAPDSFKGSLSSSEACGIMAEALEQHGQFDIVRLPAADGGEGTLDVLYRYMGGRIGEKNVSGPLGGTVRAKYGICGNRVLIESSQACGLTLLDECERNPLYTTSYGVGQLIKAALDAAPEEIYVTLGGSAVNDCGAGLLQALGAEFSGTGLHDLICGDDLRRITGISLTGLDRRLSDVRITAVCDVDNTLFGPDGAAFVFAPQKGADSAGVKILDEGLRHFSGIVEKALGKSISDIKGAGAAGGMGAALFLLGADMQRGCEMILSVAGFDGLLKNTDYVFTGEGHFDRQSFMGKATGTIYAHALKANVPVAVFFGGYDAADDTEGLRTVCITPEGQSRAEALKNAERNLFNAVIRFTEEEL